MSDHNINRTSDSQGALVTTVPAVTNYTENSMTPKTNESMNDFIQILTTTQCYVYGFIALVGIIGNIYVVTIIVKVFVGLRTRVAVYVYVLALSACDLGFLVTQLFVLIYLHERTWVTGSVTCTIMWIGETLNKTYSPYMLVILSWDRFQTVFTPIHETGNLHKACRLLCAIVTAVFACNLPVYIFINVRTHPDGGKTCAPELPNTGWPGLLNDAYTTYTLFLAFAFFLVPATLISTYYTLLIKRLKRPLSSVNIRQISMARRGRVTKTIVTVIIFYFACWTPYWIFQTYVAFGPKQHKLPQFQRMMIISALVFGLPHINSAMNPFFYGILNRRLRRAYKESVNRQRLMRLRKHSLEQVNAIAARRKSTIAHTSQHIAMQRPISASFRRRYASLTPCSTQASVITAMATTAHANVLLPTQVPLTATRAARKKSSHAKKLSFALNPIIENGVPEGGTGDSGFHDNVTTGNGVAGSHVASHVYVDNVYVDGAAEDRVETQL